MSSTTCLADATFRSVVRFGFIVAACCALARLGTVRGETPSSPTKANVLVWNARELFDRGTVRDVRLSRDGQCLELDRGVLIEDDGPAAGYSYVPNEESLTEHVVLEKQLIVADPRAATATLLVGSTADFCFKVNGVATSLEPLGKAGNYWRRYAVPVDTLVAGVNRFELQGAGKLWIALEQDYAAGSETRRHHPNRSRKSLDGGKTWTDRGLGPNGDLDGEYYVRLQLDQHPPSGVWWSPIVDLANLDHAPLSPAGELRPPFRVRATVAERPVGNVRLAVRTGPKLPSDALRSDALRSDALDGDTKSGTNVGGSAGGGGGEGGGGGARSADARTTGGVNNRSWSASHPEDSWEGWSVWQAVDDSNGSAKPVVPLGRYAQVRLELATADPRDSPRVTGLEWGLEDPLPAGPVTSAGEGEAAGAAVGRRSTPLAPWTRRVRIVEREVPVVRRSSLPFTYEPFDAATLQELRRVERLDEHVRADKAASSESDDAVGESKDAVGESKDTVDRATNTRGVGGQPEWALIRRLAAWSALRWSDGHLGQSYPPWNALEILKPHSDGKPIGGFCQQFNVVFLQACESFGLIGRAVSIGAGDHGLAIRSGHEVVEIWSNEFAKWVYIDGQAGWYFVDERGTPLSLLELRERQLAVRAGQPGDAVRLLRVAKTKWTWSGLAGWPAFAELRLIPRSDWLTRPSPLPLNQGMRGWFWSGHVAWNDDAYPASLLYGQRVGQTANWQWTGQAAAARLQATETSGELRVAIESVIPGGGTLQVRDNDQPPRRVSSEFSWTLRPGVNRLVVEPVNRADRAGAGSRFVVNFDPS
jgi:hypothetical protein